MGKVIWFALVIVCIVYGAWAYGQLPEQIPIHFDMEGKPNDWATKGNFYLWFSIGFLALNAMIFLFATPLVKKIPISALSIPWSGHWLKEENREEAYLRIYNLMYFTGVLLNFICLMGLYYTFSYHTALQISFFPAAVIPWTILVLVVVFIYWSIISFKPTENK